MKMTSLAIFSFPRDIFHQVEINLYYSYLTEQNRESIFEKLNLKEENFVSERTL